MTLALPAPGWSFAACKAPPHPRGDWLSHGHDLANSRTQPLESGPGSIDPGRARELKPLWAFYTGTPSGTPNGWLPQLNGTPIVAGGCVFVGTGSGEIIALDASTGAVIWRGFVGRHRPGLAGLVAASVAVTDDAVVALVNRKGDGSLGPFAKAFDRSTGAPVWESESVTTVAHTYTNANPVIYDGLLVFGYSALEGDPAAQGGFAIVDVAQKGAVVARTFTIPEADQARGYAGGGIWTAPAVDTQTGFAYMGSGNPYSKKVEHQRTNAILKVDLRRGSPAFGEIVASYKGEPDQSDQVIFDATRPTCDAIGENRTLYESFQQVSGPAGLEDFDGTVANSQQCGQLNLGFGAGVNLFTVAGRAVVGGLHKSGYYHLVDRSTMQRVALARMGAFGCEVCNASSPAVDADAVYAAVQPGPVVRAADRATLESRWISPIADGPHYAAVSTAGGVVYTVDGNGFLNAFDAATGEVLSKRPLTLDGATGPAELGEDAIALTAAGVAIARGMVYVSAGSQVIAFAPGD